ncbi:hypothetical protein [Levilactobacillus parabrevis]|uniref:hypothetical protein n=1 Tax=Levilactobacillus parabrevis TaxID=357278 RepID=UPI0021A2B539|nr:hypothetical protein [Levilactobacillus parabrevis]
MHEVYTGPPEVLDVREERHFCMLRWLPGDLILTKLIEKLVSTGTAGGLPINPNHFRQFGV